MTRPLVTSKQKNRDRFRYESSDNEYETSIVCWDY